MSFDSEVIVRTHAYPTDWSTRPLKCFRTKTSVGSHIRADLCCARVRVTELMQSSQSVYLFLLSTIQFREGHGPYFTTQPNHLIAHA